MEVSSFVSSFLRKVSLPRFSPTNPPPNPDLITELEATDDAQISPVDSAARSCLRSLFFLAAGDLNRAHVIVQDLSSSNAYYIHGMIHRLEGDFGNARYWFRRARVHPTAPEMYRRAAVNSLTIASHPVWDPELVTTLAEEVGQEAPSEELRAILTVEYEVLVEHLCDPMNAEEPG
jgi:hypothetical protein